MDERDVLKILRHTRHDWLNKIQLIKGYLALGKQERIEAIIQKIVHESEQESKLSSIGLPKFAAFILTYNWDPKSFILKYEVIGTEKVSNLDDNQLTSWLQLFFEAVHLSSTESEDNVLSVRIKLDNQTLSFNMDYKGILKDKAAIRDILNRVPEQFYIEEKNLENDRFKIKLNFADED